MWIVVDSQPGLKIEKWMSNGADVLAAMSDELEAYDEPTDPNFRLFPNLLYPSNGQVVGFVGSTRWLTGPFPAWESVDGFTYGSVGVDNFVFKMDESEQRAMSIEPLAYRVSLRREQ